MEFTLSDFSELEHDPSQGLTKLNFFDRLFYTLKINAFKRIFRERGTQPPFLISRQSWELLANGKQIIGSKEESWLPKGYEVYAFVLCLAFEKKGAYFRIRTLIKKEGSNGDTAQVTVETGNIAFVDIGLALENLYSGTYNDCLIFVTPDDEKRQIVDSQVIKKDKISEKFPDYHPSTLKNGNKSIIQNEGHYFTKDRIWQQILTDKYPTKNTNIFLAWNASARVISFDFKINDEYATGIQCPRPPVCQ